MGKLFPHKNDIGFEVASTGVTYGYFTREYKSLKECYALVWVKTLDAGGSPDMAMKLIHRLGTRGLV
jgi:hypothetical protein